MHEPKDRYNGLSDYEANIERQYDQLVSQERYRAIRFLVVGIIVIVTAYLLFIL